MSQENVELIRAGCDAFNQRDFGAAMALAHDSVTWAPLFTVETDVLRGKEAVLAAWTRQIEALDLHIELLELTALDESRVLAIGKWTGRGSESGAPVEQVAAQVFTVEDGKLRSVETFKSRADALEAAGLSE